MRVEDMMTRDLLVLRKTDMVSRARLEMDMSGIRHLPIVDANNYLIGLVTQRDVLAADDEAGDPISTIMREDVITVSPETPAHEVAYLLLRHSIGCVPVTNSKTHELLGIVTETDFVRVAYTKLGGQVPVDEIEQEEKEAERV